MAFPTNVRVEAVAQGMTRLRWLPDNLNALKVYRSPDGSSYTVVATLLATDVEYIDEDLTDQTKYWYKLSDDNGSSFSAVVTVVTHLITSKRSARSNFSFRPAKDASVNAKTFNDLAYQLNEELNVKPVQSTPCGLCLNDGALVIDCTSGCDWFRVVLDQDVNSISLIGCDDCPNVDFVIPPEEEYGICGWPAGCDFFGDECFKAKIPGGPRGRTAKTNGVSYDGYGDPTPQPAQGDCRCPPTEELSIKCCEPSCVINCTTNLVAEVKACGGLAPFTWSSSANVYLNKTTGTTVKISGRPATNSDTSVSGAACADAVVRIQDYSTFGTCSVGGNNDSRILVSVDVVACYSCAGTSTGCGSFCTDSGSMTLTLDGGPNCTEDGGIDMHCTNAVGVSGLGNVGQGCAQVDNFSGVSPCTGLKGPKDQSLVDLRIQYTSVGGQNYDETIQFDITADGTNIPLPGKFDVRTAQMIADGCPSCVCDTAGGTVTVTDAAGISVTEVVG